MKNRVAATLLMVFVIVAGLVGSVYAQEAALPQTSEPQTMQYQEKAAPEGSCAFPDVASDKYYFQAVAILCFAGIIAPDQAQFRGGDPVRRDETAKIISLTYGAPRQYSPPNTNCVFSDVSTSTALYEYIWGACGAGLVGGYTPAQCGGTSRCFRPSSKVTRGEVLKMSAQGLRYNGVPVVTEPVTQHYFDVYSGHWAIGYVDEMYDRYVIRNSNPDGSSRIKPNAEASRGDIVFWPWLNAFTTDSQRLGQGLPFKNVSNWGLSAYKTVPRGGFSTDSAAGPVGSTNSLPTGDPTPVFIEAGPSAYYLNSGGYYAFYSYQRSDGFADSNIATTAIINPNDSFGYRYYVERIATNVWTTNWCDYSQCYQFAQQNLGRDSLPTIASGGETIRPSMNLGSSNTTASNYKPVNGTSHNTTWCPDFVVNNVGATQGACNVGTFTLQWTIPNGVPLTPTP